MAILTVIAVFRFLISRDHDFLSLILVLAPWLFYFNIFIQFYGGASLFFSVVVESNWTIWKEIGYLALSVADPTIVVFLLDCVHDVFLALIVVRIFSLLIFLVI